MKIKDSRSAVLNGLKYLILIIGGFILFFPFIYMVLSGLKTAYESTAIPPIWFPAEAQWSNFAYAWSVKPFLTYYLNTLIVCAITVIGTLVFSIMGAYAFTIYDFPCKNLLFVLFMLTMMVPEEMLIIQNYETVSNLKLLGTYMGIALPSLANGFYIFMLREYFMQMPSSLYKSAKVDHCSDMKFLWRVMVPMNKNAIFTIGILSFIGEWNAFMWPNMVAGNGDAHRVITSGLMTFRNQASTNYHYLMAASCITVLPMIVFYIIFRKKIIAGVANGGIKG